MAYNLLEILDGPSDPVPAPRSARFWTWTGQAYVRLTLRPGQTLSRVTGGRHDEGWSYTRTRWTHEGDRVRRVVESDGVDCDGRLSSCETSWCSLDRLASWQSPYEDAPMLPDWQDGRYRQRDYRAEEYGY